MRRRGTRDYGRFLVASGPYQFAGSENLDFSLPADEQTPVAGYEPGKSIVLVRNPNYDPATDGLRPAYPDGFNISIGGDNNDLYNKVQAGELDGVDGIVPPPVLRSYSTDPTLQPLLHINPSDAVRYISFNMAIPPFDDVHVKALNLALDKAGMRTFRGGESVGEIAGHIMVNSLEDNLLADYDPYATPNSAGDVTAAQAEMAQSAYDTTATACATRRSAPTSSPRPTRPTLPGPGRVDPAEHGAARADVRREVLRAHDDVLEVQRAGGARRHLSRPRLGQGLPGRVHVRRPAVRIGAIFPSCCNYQLVGRARSAVEGRLRHHRGPVGRRPDQTANQQTGDARFQAWADLDTTLMEQVVPWVPYLFDNNVDITSERIINYSFDQFSDSRRTDQSPSLPRPSRRERAGNRKNEAGSRKGGAAPRGGPSPVE